ncbi:TIGR00159 family protein [Pseudoflavonifractor sp. 60]|nr:TIGR00159 family protein [Pseudoflavonifractor sp. 60]
MRRDEVRAVAELIHGLQLFLQSNFPLLQIQLTDILDIAILSFVIYKLMWMLRKTSSGRLMWGVLILMTVMFLSSDNVLSLTATSFVLDKLVQWGIVVLVILFQPEIRRFLERMGSGRLGMVFAANKEPGQDMETAIIQTTEAYTDLSRDKVGALMVFERQNLLDDVIKTGTELDCSVSSELLKNIFWNKAPLHDGAVIVRDGRIVGAGCMLPLSGNVNLSRDLGMRHRAGIGMSEHSDAVVVIVSEETGSISAAVGGMLKRHLAPETLERLLRNELLNDKQEEKRGNSLPLLGLLLGAGRKEEDDGL